MKRQTLRWMSTEVLRLAGAVGLIGDIGQPGYWLLFPFCLAMLAVGVIFGVDRP